MLKSDKLKQERAAKIKEQQRIINLAKTENRELKDEENTSLDALDGEIESLDEDIDKALKSENRERRLAATFATDVVGDAESREVVKIKERASLVKVMRGLTSKGGFRLDGAEKELHEMGVAENREAGVKTPEDTAFSFPINTVQRATQQTVSEDGGDYGGKLVQDQPLRMIEGLRPKLFLEELGATFFMGLNGGDLPLISSDAFKMEYLGEVEAVTPQKQKFGGKVLSPKRTAGAFDISNRLLMQSSIDVESWILNEITKALGSVIQSGAINGDGMDSNPKGLLQMANILFSGDDTAIVASWEKMIELQGLIEENNATENSLGYLIHPKVKAILKTIKKDAGSGEFVFKNNMIDDLKTVASTLVPKLTDVYPVIYGDWTQLFMGQWGAVNFQANPYSADLSNATRFTINTYSDSTVVNEKAFAVNKWIKGSNS